MTIRLADLPVTAEGLEGRAGEPGLGFGTQAVLNEIVTLLERLGATGEPSAIDVKSLPMSPGDRAQLQAALGQGEVLAKIDADGVSEVRETKTPGVWWIEHRNARGERIAEFIEITRIPEILIVAAEDLGRGAQELRARIAPRRAAPTKEAS